MCRLDRSTNLLSSKLNSTYNHCCPNNCQKNEYTLSEHVKTVSKVSIFSRGTIVIQHCLNPPAGILFHSSIMTSRSCWMLYTRCFSTFCLRMPHMCAIGTYLATPSPSPCAARQLENRFWREGIIFCFRMSQYMLESMFPSINRSSPVWAVVMQPQTMMLPPPCLTVGKARFSWYFSPGRRHTCWTPSESNKFTLDSSDYTIWFQ